MEIGKNYQFILENLSKFGQPPWYILLVTNLLFFQLLNTTASSS